MKSDQILFHPVVPKRQASQNDQLANGTANQNELAPCSLYCTYICTYLQQVARLSSGAQNVEGRIKLNFNNLAIKKYCFLKEQIEI